MIRSMTGFGEASGAEDGVHYFVEVRSLNNKYFKSHIRLPEELQGLEADLESTLRKHISRGSVTLRASFTDVSEDAAHEVNAKALDRYIAMLREVEAVKKGELTIDVGTLLSLPGVLQPPPNEEHRVMRARDALRSLTDKACEHLIAMRKREGHMLLDDLLRQRDGIAQRLERIRELAPSVSTDYEQRLQARLERLVKDAGIGVEPIELVREVASYAERTDIAEEIARLAGHIEQFSELTAGDDDAPVGRTLDFLAQEMLREANTIASKSPDSEISRLTVEIKGAIDRIKEQVQNAE